MKSGDSSYRITLDGQTVAKDVIVIALIEVPQSSTAASIDHLLARNQDLDFNHAYSQSWIH